MRIVYALLALVLLFPVQASALDLKPLMKEILRATDTVQFSDFRTVDRGDGRYDWYVTLTNRGQQDLAKNRYELQTYQEDRLGKRYSASGTISIDVEIKTGQALYLQLPFTPHTDINTFGFVFASKRNGAVLGARKFNASSAAGNGPGQQPATTPPATSSTTAPKPEDFTPIDLKLRLNELPRNKFQLEVTNQGSGKIDLRHYVFSVTANMLMRPDSRTNFSFDSTTLSPGRTAKSRAQQLDATRCANLESFTLTAQGKNNNQFFEQVQTVPANDVRVQPISIILDRMERGIDEYSSIQIVLEVKNTGSRSLTDAELSGTLFFKVKSTSAPEYMLNLSNINAAGFPLRPGQKKRMHFLIRVGTLADHGVLTERMYILHRKKPLLIEFRGQLGSPGYCGVPVFYDDVQIRQAFRRAN